jgi:hypothetical protein
MGGFQDLIGVFVTLIAAFIGFGGVIYSQRALVRMTRNQDAAKNERELRSFENAMVGELSALQLSITNSLQLLNAQIGMAQQMAKRTVDKKTQPRITFHFATPVFDSHVSRIGLLSPDLSFKVSSLYGRLKSYSLQSQNDVPELEAELAAKVMDSVNSGLISLQQELEELKVSLRAVIKS